MHTAMRMTLAIATSCAAMMAMAGDDSATSEVSGEIVGSCTIAAENGGFGQVPIEQAGTAVDTTVNLTVNCSNSVLYQIALDPSVPMDFLSSLDQAAGNPASQSSLTFSANELTLINGAGAIGTLSYWTDVAKTTAMDVGTAANSRTGTGADETIPITVSWLLPSADALSEESFGLWTVTNTYNILF